MSGPWHYQIRVYLPEELAGIARTEPGAPVLRPLVQLLQANDATLVSQLDAFEAYVAQAEKENADDPLCKWTKATLADPAKRLKHMKAFAVRIAGQEVYAAERANALEAALQPLVGGGLVERLSRHDTNPAVNLAIPNEYRT
ncbi:hypothetical protein [Falsiroseomonas sp. HW251]|uniref:hypothetical protein n=1 Tax=Falsiroseomonas sp. HW251 TaxID=3390998 RepID=UPI003D3177BC